MSIVFYISKNHFKTGKIWPKLYPSKHLYEVDHFDQEICMWMRLTQNIQNNKELDTELTTVKFPNHYGFEFCLNQHLRYPISTFNYCCWRNEYEIIIILFMSWHVHFVFFSFCTQANLCNINLSEIQHVQQEANRP